MEELWLRGRRRAARLLVVLLTAATLAGSPSAFAAGSSAGVLRAETTLRWSGTAGTVLTLAEDVADFGNEGTLVRLGEDATYAFVVMSPRACIELCVQGRASATQPTGMGHFFAVPGLVAGDYDFYLFSDGSATLHINKPGLLPAGSTDVTADGTFTNEFHTLDLTCETPACNVRYGGMVFDVTEHDTLVSVYGRAQVPGGQDPWYEPGQHPLYQPGAVGGTACMHPQWPDEEFQQPAKGCDLLTERTELKYVGATASMVGTAWVNGPGYSEQRWSVDAQVGPVHVGTRLHGTGGVQEPALLDGYAYLIQGRVQRR